MTIFNRLYFKVQPVFVIFKSLCFDAIEMKRLYFLILTILIVACGRQHSEPITAKTQTIQPINRSSYFVEQIKSNSIKRQNHYTIDSLDVEMLRPLDSTFFKTYFDGLAIDNINDEEISFDKWSRCYFFDYTEVNDQLCFSFKHEDEVGYDNVYHVTFDISSNKILSSDLIAAKEVMVDMATLIFLPITF